MMPRSDQCQDCKTIVHRRTIATGRKTPPYYTEIGGCEWYNGRFLCPGCVKKAIEMTAKRTDITVIQYFRAMNNREKVFPMCDMKGCYKKPVWQVEYVDDEGQHVESHLCNECYPQDPEINKHFVSVKKL